MSIKLAPCEDPSPLGRARLLDIANQPLTAIVSGRQPFAYSNSHVILRYEKTPRVPHFSGHLKASRLKPNFAYQLKLVGKPQHGSHGWGAFGDDAANERLGYAGRWWCDTEHLAVKDDHYVRHYQNAESGQKHTVYGYLFMGVLVTDERGESNGAVTGANSYHITWQEGQTSKKLVQAGDWTVQSAPPYYGYGHTVPPQKVRLWYETAQGRETRVELPAGSYNCRLVLTEESFHNGMPRYSNNGHGGFWHTVLATEARDAAGQPDRNPANDIRFVIADFLQAAAY